MKNRIYQLIMLTDDGHGNYCNEFLLGTYATQERANEEKDIVEEQAREQNLDVQYQINEHIVIE